MKQELTENAGLPAHILWTLAIVAGVTIANQYYNQPLLNLIRQDLAETGFRTNVITMMAQTGYALGLLFIVPLGDLCRRRTIILTNFVLLIFSLFAIGIASNLPVIWAASLITGACSVIPQIFVPIASQFSRPEHKSRNVGIVMSGLLTGILASRVISGFVGDWFGWRAMYFIAAVLMILCAAVTLKILPDIRPNFTGSYGNLMRSIFTLVKQYPSLRICSLRAAFAFGSFLAVWACLAFKMAQAPFHADSDTVGILGLCGIAGALTASAVGQYVGKVGLRNFNYIGDALILLAWLIMGILGDTYTGMIAGIIIIDIGIQCIQLSNQSSVMQLNPKAANRVNTVFMTTFFIGGTFGTFSAGTGWQLAGWTGVVAVGIALALLPLCFTLFTRH